MTARPLRSLTPDAIDARLRRLYGVVDWRAATGVVHVAAIADSGRAVIIPGHHAPPSDTDRFVLASARARADAILTTGAILRGEPGLRHDASTDSAENLAFSEWRRTRLGRTSQPILIVMSASGDLPAKHPALEAARGGIVWTTRGGAARLRGRFGESVGRLDIIAEEHRKSVGIRGAIAHVLARSDVETILVEAGPNASSQLYVGRGKMEQDRDEPQRQCDELLLNRYIGELASLAAGPPFISQAAINDCFQAPPHEMRIEEDFGIWIISRYRSN